MSKPLKDQDLSSTTRIRNRPAVAAVLSALKQSAGSRQGGIGFVYVELGPVQNLVYSLITSGENPALDGFEGAENKTAWGGCDVILPKLFLSVPDAPY